MINVEGGVPRRQRDFVTILGPGEASPGWVIMVLAFGARVARARARWLAGVLRARNDGMKALQAGLAESVGFPERIGLRERERGVVPIP